MPSQKRRSETVESPILDCFWSFLSLMAAPNVIISLFKAEFRQDFIGCLLFHDRIPRLVQLLEQLV